MHIRVKKFGSSTKLLKKNTQKNGFELHTCTVSSPLDHMVKAPQVTPCIMTKASTALSLRTGIQHSTLPGSYQLIKHFLLLPLVCTENWPFFKHATINFKSANGGKVWGARTNRLSVNFCILSQFLSSEESWHWRMPSQRCSCGMQKPLSQWKSWSKHAGILQYWLEWIFDFLSSTTLIC